MATSIQQASINSLVSYLSSVMPGVTIEDRWPDPSRKFTEPAITIHMTTPRSDIPIDFMMTGFQNLAGNKVQYQTQIAACEQMFQMDVWARNQIERDDILAQLDTV